MYCVVMDATIQIGIGYIYVIVSVHDNPTERRNGPAGFKSYYYSRVCIVYYVQEIRESYFSFLVLSSISTFYKFFFFLNVLMTKMIREVSILYYILIQLLLYSIIFVRQPRNTSMYVHQLRGSFGRWATPTYKLFIFFCYQMHIHRT